MQDSILEFAQRPAEGTEERSAGVEGEANGQGKEGERIRMSIDARTGYGYVNIDRSGLYPRTYLMTPEEDPEKRQDGLSVFMAPFDGKLVFIEIKAVPPEEEARLRELDRKVRAAESEDEDD